MTRQAVWRNTRLEEGKCGNCGRRKRALDKRRHMRAMGRRIRLCRTCADEMALKDRLRRPGAGRK